jgi:hypothetical protein
MPTRDARAPFGCGHVPTDCYGDQQGAVMRRWFVAGTALMVIAGLAGCAAAPTPFDGERSVRDKLPAIVGEFVTTGDPATSRYQGHADGYDLYLVKGTGTVQICLVYTDMTAEHSGAACGGGDQLGAGLPGGAEFRIQTGGFADKPQSGEVQVSRWVRQTAGTDR